jgi:hypothetical protein
MIKVLAAAIPLAGLLAVPSASAVPAAPRPPACTHPAVVNDGLLEVTCFPVIPAKQFPPAGTKCNHVDSWVTGHSFQTVNGQQYRITQKVRDDVWICKS